MLALKVLHLLFLFLWMGSLLILTRLAASAFSEEEFVQKRFLALCRRFYLRVELPAMLFALVTGIAFFFYKGVSFKQGWLHMKLTFAFILVVTDILFGRALIAEKKSALKFKIFHIIAAFSLLAILISVYILKRA